MFAKNLSLQRLGYSIEQFQQELEALIEEAKSRSDNHKLPNWQPRSRHLLELAKAAHKSGDAEGGWHVLKAADRFSFFGLNQDGLRIEASAILAEATDSNKTTSEWRRAAILRALADKDGTLKESLLHREVVRAKRILDEQQDNRYHKNKILKRRLGIVTAISAAAAVVWIAAPPFSPVLPPQPQLADVVDGRRLWFAVILMGIMGALVSGFSTSTTSNQNQSRIPDELVATTVTLARIAMAVITSLVVSVFLLSGLLNLASPNLGVLLAVAFAAGFSDRLLLRAIESISQ